MQLEAACSEALLRKYPEQVVIAIAKDHRGKHNPITLGWTMITSGNPPMMAISVAPPRYSHDVIQEAGEFVISFPSSAMAKEALFFGTKSGRDMDKLAEMQTATQPATKINSLLLADAVANFECILDGQLTTGDHTIFAGRIVAAHVNQEPAIRRLYTLRSGYDMGGVAPG